MELFNYYLTGGLKVLETGMIILLLVFLGWNVKLYLEKRKPNDRPLEDDLEQIEETPVEK